MTCSPDVCELCKSEEGAARDSGRTWRSESSPSWVTLTVGVVSKKPESATSSTDSPMESTTVAFTNDTTM